VGEYLRSHLFSGFGWLCLGHSQVMNLYFVQVVDVIGVYGLSWVIVFINCLIFFALTHKRIKLVLLAAMVLVAVYAYGVWTVWEYHRRELPTVSVVMVQPNVAQEIKWIPSMREMIVNKHLQLTGMLANQEPGVLGEQAALVDKIRTQVIHLGVPLIFGGIVQEDNKYYNSALMINAIGDLQERYDKIHLVPFGEYIPLRPLLGWINHFVPLEDFSSGQKYSMFTLTPDTTFGVLICFEDTIGYLWHEFIRRDAGFLVNMTNDAWFQDTSAPFLHLHGAAINAISYKRSLVRSANTGWTGVIDPLGRVLKKAEDLTGKQTFVSSVIEADVPVNQQKTVYAKLGNIFVFIEILVILITVLIKKRRVYV
jgi:apolipoprotein N-acyltransferase